MPAIGSSFDSHQEYPVEITDQILVSRMQAGNVSSHGLCLHWLSVGVQFADQGFSVFFGGRSEMGDEGFDQFPTGAA